MTILSLNCLMILPDPHFTQLITHTFHSRWDLTSNMPEFNILFFGPIKDLVGTAQITASLEADDESKGNSVNELFEYLKQTYPQVRQSSILPSCAVAVDLHYVDLDEQADEPLITTNCEVALIPPVSSG